jgi:hypothetical protein
LTGFKKPLKQFQASWISETFHLLPSSGGCTVSFILSSDIYMDSTRLEEILKVLGPERADLQDYLQPEQILESFGSTDLDARARGDFDSYGVHKIFNPYLDLANSFFIRPLQLYGKYREELNTRYKLDNSTLYFIVKRKKMRFVLEEVGFEEDRLQFSILIENEKKEAYELSFLPLLADKDTHEIKDELDCHYWVLLDKEKSNENALYFAIHTFSGKSIEISLFPHDLLSNVSAAIDDISEIIYIGQSRNMSQRTLAHEKIQQSLSEVGDREDIYLYFFTIQERVIFHNSYVPGFCDNQDISDQGRLNLVEMAFINYFKPKYNK